MDDGDEQETNTCKSSGKTSRKGVSFRWEKQENQRFATVITKQLKVSDKVDWRMLAAEYNNDFAGRVFDWADTARPHRSIPALKMQVYKVPEVIAALKPTNYFKKSEL
jgi:hypothetical protein